MMGKNDAADEAKRARQDEEARQARIREGTENINTTFGQFDDDFFGGRRQSYVDFARPQIDEQYGDAKDQLTYGLARSGLGSSSIAGEQYADLEKDYTVNLQDIVDKARAYETEARNSVEGARADLVAMLNSTGDAVGAGNAAINRSAALSKAPAYSPIGQLFTDFSAGLSQQAALERAEAASGRDYARYNTGLFGASPGAVKTT